jgi:hypothetical protein
MLKGLIMLKSFFKKSSVPNPAIKMLSVALVNKVGMTDESFEALFTPFIEMLVLSGKEEKIIKSTEELLGDGYFHLKGKKPSFFIFYCLLCSEVSLSDKQNRFCSIIGLGEIPEITKCVVFYSVLTHTKEGYKWALSNPDLLAEAWKYLKNGSGKYKVIMQKILHEESEILNIDDGEEELDTQHFDSSDQNEIASMFDTIAPANSVESLLDEVTEADITGNDDGIVQKDNEAEDITDEKADGTDASTDNDSEMIDITSMLKQSN